MINQLMNGRVIGIDGDRIIILTKNNKRFTVNVSSIMEAPQKAKHKKCRDPFRDLKV